MKTSPLLQVLGAALLAAISTFAAAQAYPSRPITVVVPFAAGGPTDTIGHVGTHVIAGAVQKTSYDVYADFEPIGLACANPQIIVTKMDVPAKDLKELIAWTKANGDKVSSGTGGPGTPSHIMAVYYNKETGSNLQVIHYKGSGPALQDVIAGHVDMTFDQAANALPQVRAGKIKAYAVTSKNRLTSQPDIPTVDEAGLPNFYMSVWHAFWAPKGTPKEIVNRLNAALVETLADPAVQKRLQDLGQELFAREQQTPEALRAWHKAEIDKWWPLIKTAGIKSE
jgi:tripartite-type tricarboxylate transporter receptor subunit TctC